MKPGSEHEDGDQEASWASEVGGQMSVYENVTDQDGESE